MSWQEAVTDVADTLAQLAEEYETTVDRTVLYRILGAAQGLRFIVKSAPTSTPSVQRGAVDTLQAERVLKKLAEAEELRSSSQAMRLCVGGSLDGTYIPSGGVEIGKPVKSPINGERYVLQEDGIMHFCETP